MMLCENYIVNRIEELCKKKNMSRYRLSQKSGISQSSISNLFNRKSLPSLITLDKICNGLDITLSQFFLQDETTVDLTDEQSCILEEWSSLTEIEKELVKAYIQGIRRQ